MDSHSHSLPNDHGDNSNVSGDLELEHLQSGLFAKLPDYILVKIFSMIPPQVLGKGVAKTCKRFRKLCLSKQCYSFLDLSRGDIPPDRAVSFVHESGEHIKTIIFGDEPLEGSTRNTLPAYSPEAVVTILGKLPSIESVAFNNAVWLQDEGFSTILKTGNVSQLRSLAIRRSSRITDQAILNFTRLCGEHIYHLDLASNELITDRAVDCIVRDCPHLKSLSLSRCSRLTDTCLRHLSWSIATGIVSLNISGIESISDDGIAALCHVNPETWQLAESPSQNADSDSDAGSVSADTGVGVNRPTRVRVGSGVDFLPDGFEAGSSDEDDDDVSSDDDGFETEYNKLGCRFLRKFDISHCPKLTACSIRAIMNGVFSHTLTDLNAAECKGFADADIDLNFGDLSIPIHLSPTPADAQYDNQVSVSNYGYSPKPKLCNVSFQECALVGDTTFSLLAAGGRLVGNLISLNLAECRGISDKCLVSALIGIGVGENDKVKAKPKLKLPLENLIVSECSVSDASMTEILPHCPRLKEFACQGCSDITDATLNALQCDNLCDVTFSHCPKISDVGVAGLASRAPLLREIDLSYCIHVTEKSIAAIVSHCHSLLALSLRHCHAIGDAALRELSHLEKLHALDLTWCTRVTDVGVEALVKRDGQTSPIDILSLSWCNVTDKTMHLMGRYCPLMDHFSVRYCVKVTSEGLESFVRKVARIKARPGVNLSVSKNEFGGIDDSSKAVGHTANPIARLSSEKASRLSHRRTRTVQVKTDEQIQRDPFLPHLRFLDVRGCANIGEDVVLKLRKKFPPLDLRSWFKIMQ